MDRRRFLGLLGIGSAVIATPEPVRSYFFGPWAPRASGLFAKDGLVLVEGPPGPDKRYLLDLVDKRILSRAAVLELLGADHPDWRVLSQFDIQSLAEQVVIHRPGTHDYASFLVEDLTDLSDARLRDAYTDKVVYSFGRRDKLSLDLARAGLNEKQRERVLRRMARKPGPVAHAITHGERVRFWTPEAA